MGKKVFGTQLVAPVEPWTKGVLVPVVTTIVVVAPVVVGVVVWVPMEVGEEPCVIGAIVPVHALPLGQQAAWPALSIEHTSVVLQHKPG